ncbi:hypothetical protein CSHISOI_10404, partial [Colletotrichum shisoi]
YSPKTADACAGCAAPDVASASHRHRDPTAELMMASNTVEPAEQKQECEASRPTSPHPDLAAGRRCRPAATPRIPGGRRTSTPGRAR